MTLTLEDLREAAKHVLPSSQIGRHELTNEQWRYLRKIVPDPTNRRGSPRSNRKMLNACLWILRTGAPWRDLPEKYGPWQTAWKRFDQWRKSGKILEIKAALLQLLNDHGQIDWELWCVDGTNVRASRSAAGASKKRRRKKSPKTTHSGDHAGDSARKSTS